MNRNDKVITGLVMVSHALVHTYELTIPILMVIWLIEFNTTAAALGIVVSIGYGLFGLGALPAGTLSDKYGSQRLIVLCLAGMGISFVVLSFATDLLFVAVAIGLWGAAASIYHPAGLSLISTGVERRGTGFAYHGMAGNIGIAFGPLLTVLLLLFFGWRTVTLVLAVPAFLAIALVLKLEINEMAATESISNGSSIENLETIDSFREFIYSTKHLFIGGFIFIFLIIMFNGLYYRGVLTFLPDMLADTIGQFSLETEDELLEDNFQSTDLVYVGLLMMGVAGQYVGGKATDRIQTEKGLLFGYAMLMIIALLFILAMQLGSIAFVIVSLLLGFFLFMLQPVYQATVAEYSPAEARGLSYGYTYLAQFGVGAIGAAVVGIVLTYSTISASFLLLSGFALVAALLSLALLLRNG